MALVSSGTESTVNGGSNVVITLTIRTLSTNPAWRILLIISSAKGQKADVRVCVISTLYSAVQVSTS